MEKETFIKYVEMLNRFEKLSKEEASIYSNTQETKVIAEVRKLVEKDPELMEFLKQLHALPEKERMQAVTEHFSKKENKEEASAKSEEEEIAKTFGVDINKIEHKFLSTGNEIFSFYDLKLGRQVVLENNQKGKTLVEYLKEIQVQNEKYQTENEETNSNEILNDQRLTENIELKMLTKEEILNRQDNFSNIANEDAAKLKYLLQNYDRLRIKGINLENLIYIDEDNKIHEAVINEKQEVVVANPEDASYSDNSYDSNAPVETTTEDSNELNSMVEESTEEKEDEDSYNLSGNEYENELDKEKVKVLTHTKDDKYGFVNNVLFIAIITAVVLIITLVYYIIRYYA